MDRRKFLGFGAGLASSVLVGNSLKEELNDGNMDDFIASIGIFEDKVESIANKKSDREIKGIKKRANETTKSGETFLDYSINFFEDTEFIDENKGIKKMPEDIREILAPVIPGLLSQESRFRKGATHPSSGARGSTQILKGNTIYKDKPFMKFMPIQIRECFRHFETIWTTLFRNIDFDSFKSEYGLSDSEFNNFIVLSMINSYNTGQGRMVKIINKFQKDIPCSVANKRQDKTAEGLFNVMSELAYNKKWSSGYGDASFGYTPGCLAYAKALDTGEISSSALDYHRVLSRGVGTKVDSILDNNPPSAIVVSGGVGLATMAVANNIQKGSISDNVNNISKGVVGGVSNSVNSLLSDDKTARRDFLKQSSLLGLGLGGAALAGLNSDNVLNKDLKLPDLDFLLPDFDSDSEFIDNSEEYIEKGDAVIGELTKYYKTNKRFFTGASLLEQKKEKYNILKNKKYKRNYTKRVLPVLGNLDEDYLYKVRNKDINKGLDDFDFVGIPIENEYWRLHGIGHNYKVISKNAYLREEGYKVLQDVTKNFKDKLKDAGISDGWTIRPIITSLTRSVEQNTGSKDSVHQNGLGIDISYTRFDLIDEENNFYIDLNKSNDSKARAIKEYAQSLMLQVIDEMDKDGKLIFTNETQAKRGAHYHISSIES